jgi:hypothetical protein
MKDHSPGPWAVSEDDRPGMSYNRHVVQARRPHLTVCFMTSDGPNKANATLIAAAPDLLALARQYASECAECMGKAVSDDTGRDCEQCADIRAVISKATAHS